MPPEVCFYVSDLGFDASALEQAVSVAGAAVGGRFISLLLLVAVWPHRSIAVVGAGDVQPAHLVLQSRPLQSEPFGGSAVACYPSRRCSHSFDDYVPLGFLESTDWCRNAARMRYQKFGDWHF